MTTPETRLDDAGASAPNAGIRPGVLAISIIVPVLNEGEIIAQSLARLRERARGAEIIVVDGGSSDETAERAETFCDLFLRAPRGRAAQMNAGAKSASGDVLWFLHADAEPPEHCLDEITRAVRDGGVVGLLPYSNWPAAAGVSPDRCFRPRCCRN